MFELSRGGSRGKRVVKTGFAPTKKPRFIAPNTRFYEKTTELSLARLDDFAGSGADDYFGIASFIAFDP